MAEEAEPQPIALKHMEFPLIRSSAAERRSVNDDSMELLSSQLIKARPDSI